jgi:hypothetical protein
MALTGSILVTAVLVIGGTGLLGASHPGHGQPNTLGGRACLVQDQALLADPTPQLPVRPTASPTSTPALTHAPQGSNPMPTGDGW